VATRRDTVRRTLLLAASLTACASAASTASASEVVKMKVAFEPNRAGVRTTIEFAFKISGPHGAIPSPATSLDLRLPSHMGIATSTLGQANCNPQDLIEGGLHGCSANARIGFGDALAVVPFGHEGVREPVSINALMGPPVNERLEVVFYAEGLSPVFAALVFPGTVLADMHPFGERIDTVFPLVSAWPEGPNVALESFKTTIGPLHLTYHRQVNGKTISYRPHGVSVPKRCPPGGFPFAAELTFEDGTRTTASYNVPCPRA
jgi:hypothetical protein